MALNPKPSLLQPDEWSPNQIAKRDIIIQAAARIMNREGVRACTARSVAKASGLSTSALHYYFRDIDEVADLAFRRVIERYLSNFENVDKTHGDPVEALWSAACTYLERSTDPKMSSDSNLSRAPMLWFEFHGESLRSGNLDTVRELAQRGGAVFTQLLNNIGGLEPVEERAEALYCSLLGASIRNSILERPVENYAADLLRALDLPLPSSVDA